MDALTTITSLARGQLLDELTEALLVVGEEVVNTGKPGAVSVTFKLTQTAPGEPSILVEEKIVRKAPQKAARGAILFIGDREFHRRDPRQEELDFRVVEPPPSKVIEVDANSTVVSVRDVS